MSIETETRTEAEGRIAWKDGDHRHGVRFATIKGLHLNVFRNKEGWTAEVTVRREKLATQAEAIAACEALFDTKPRE